MTSELPGHADPSVDPGLAATSPSPAAPLRADRQDRPKGGLRGGWLLMLLLVAFAGGIAATLWALPRMQPWWSQDSAEQTAGDNQAQPLLNESAAAGGSAGSPAQAPTSLDVATLEARLAAVSTQLDVITEQASNAGGNAARAEGLLIAFAARRALDRGAALGYLEGELRLRFGNSQPRAVATIINAANAPVTIADLQAGLEDVTPALLGTDGVKRDWWTATKQELANLVIIRKAGAPSPVPQKVIERARLLILVGRVDDALHEIERLPDHKAADNWVQMARKYNEARRALDVIEAAAILEPRSIPVVKRPAGGQTMQVAPLPPEAPRAATGN